MAGDLGDRREPRELRLPSADFRREREASWRELEALLERAEERGLARLEPGELARLPVLYRAAVSSLSVARAISLDKNLLLYLESLCGRAYLAVYGAKRRLGEALVELLAVRAPQAFRRLGAHLALAAAVVVLGAAVASVEVTLDEARFDAFVDAAYAEGRGPSSSTAELREVLYSGGERAGDQLGGFAAFLFTHNARIGILAFALGFAAGIPTLYLLFTNGLVLGAFAALYARRGLALDFWAWILPHGVTELGAVVVCGAAGLAVAEGLLFPGRHVRLANLAERGRSAGLLVAAAVAMFLVAGLVEGVFRQRIQALPVRLGVAAGSAVVWTLFFGLAGRRRR